MGIPVKMNIPLNNEVNAFVTRSHASLIDKDLLQRFTDVTGQEPHRFLRRGIVFSHRDLETILDKYERKEPFYVFTGRGPSSDSLHLGHSIPFEFTKYVNHLSLRNTSTDIVLDGSRMSSVLRLS
jgi:tryptophanyl-tRNA synthetase